MYKKKAKLETSTQDDKVGLEYEIRRRFYITEPYSFSTLVYRLADSKLNNISREQILNLIELREKTAHINQMDPK